MLPLLSCFSHVRLCDPVNCRPPGSSVHGILQARILEWAAVPSSTEADSLPLNHQGSPYMCVCVCVLYHAFWETNFLPRTMQIVE